MQDVAADLADTIHLAEAAGIADEKIILDPGVGFGKTYENNLEIINCLEELNMFGIPAVGMQPQVGHRADTGSAGDGESGGNAGDYHVRRPEGMYVCPGA